MGSLPPPSPEIVAKNIEALDANQRKEWMKSFLNNLSPEAGVMASNYLNDTNKFKDESRRMESRVEVLDPNARVSVPVTHHFVGNAS